MIQGYQPPQLLIRQSLQNVDTTTRERLSALVLGAQYTWPDTDTDTVEKAAVDSETITYELKYTNSDDIEVFASEANGYRLDESSITFWLEGAEIPLHDGELDASTSLSKPNQFRLDASQILRSTSTNLDAAFNGREIQVGDTVYIDETATNRSAKRKVTGFLGVLSDPEYTVISNFGSNPIASTAEAATLVRAPGNVSGITGGTTSVTLNLKSEISKYLVNGHRFTDELGYVRAGNKATIRVLSFDAEDETGTAIISFEDGLTAKVIADFTWDAGTYTVAFASGSLPHVTVSAGLSVVYLAGQAPAVGDEFVVTVRIAYELADSTIFAITDSFGDAPVKDNRFYVKVKTGNSISGSGPFTYGNAVVTVYDKNGILPAVDVTVVHGTPITINFGDTDLSVTIDAISTLTQTGLRKGDIYYFDYTAPVASTVDFDGVTLDGPAAIGSAESQTLTIYFRNSANGEVTADDFADGNIPFAVNAENGTVSLENTVAWTKYVSAFSSGNQYVTIVANGDEVTDSTVHVTWRASKIPALSEGIITIASISDLDQLGVIDPKNDLAFGAMAALQGANGKTVYAIRVAGDTVEDFETTLAKIEREDYTYALSPISDLKEVGKTVANHCEDMSAEDVKNFRRAYFGVDSPGDYILADEVSEGNPYTATITAYSGGNLRVTFIESIDLNTLGAKPGDFIVVDGETFTIAQVLPNGSELILKNGPAFPYTVPVEVVVWRKDTADSQGAYVEGIAGYINSRRCPVVWTEGGMGYDALGNLIPVSAKFAAAYVAGLRSTTIPWLGLSRAQVSLLVSAAPMYLKYSKAILNRMASNGVFILTQTVEDGAVYVRHQLTSDVSHGALAYEDSIGTNLDDLSFQFKDAFEPLIGITNVTNETLRVAEQRGTTILVEARTSETDPLIGPQIIQFYDENLAPGQITVKVHPTFKDRIIAKAQVELPLPNNTTIIELTAVSGISL